MVYSKAKDRVEVICGNALDMLGNIPAGVDLGLGSGRGIPRQIAGWLRSRSTRSCCRGEGQAHAARFGMEADTDVR